MNEINAQNAPVVQAIGPEQISKFMRVLQAYHSAKAKTDRRVQSAENWWKMRNLEEEGNKQDNTQAFNSQSGWLHNVVTNKQADCAAAYPEPTMHPQEEMDKSEAKMLTSIIPCILEENRFKETYNMVQGTKCKFGTGIYKCVWDKSKLNGMGDISIEKCNILNLYWEPGIEDIQKSRYFFHTELVDKDVLLEMYPELDGKSLSNTFVSAKFLYDEQVTDDNKITVIEVYYHRHANGRKILHYCKFVGDQIIYATENETEQPVQTVVDPITGISMQQPVGMSMAERGLYDHGLYPYVFDPMFLVEGSPAGYGFIDLCKNPQTAIDKLNTAFVRNAMAGTVPRYFSRQDGSVNIDDFLDLNKTIINVNGNLGEDSLRQVVTSPLDGNYIAILDRIIQEMRETTGNTETSTGTANSGVTAAAAIAALQEASGKISRYANESGYTRYADLIYMVIELIRQFYDLPRKFRITGQYGEEQFVNYTNAGLKPQHQGYDFGQDMGYRKPMFDITVEPQKKSAYTTVAQNELAIQFFNLGFFNPNMADQALMCLDMMEFEGKDSLMQKISQNGTLHQKLIQYMQLCLAMAQESHPEMVDGLSQDIMQIIGASSGAPMIGSGSIPSLPQADAITGKGNESTHMQNARAQSNNASMPRGGAITGQAKGDGKK